MFDELEKYQKNDHFFFSKEDQLIDVCNAPKTGMGVYLVYALKNGDIELVYIGSTGKILQDGRQKARVGGIADRIINGKQFGEPRKKSWKAKLVDEHIEALDIYWFETVNKKYCDIPATVEGAIMQRFFDVYGTLPKWNVEF